MSYITAKVYYETAEALAVAYAAVRDALYDDGLTDTYAKVNDIVDVIVEATDDDSDASTSIVHTETRDPKGSIAKDLGRVYSDLSTKFTLVNAKVLAAAYFSPALKVLNTHVVSKTALPLTGNMRTINEYYAAYAQDPRVTGGLDDDMSLFTHSDGGDVVSDASYYFSDDFVELSSQAGVTIAAAYQASTYA